MTTSSIDSTSSKHSRNTFFWTHVEFFRELSELSISPYDMHNWRDAIEKTVLVYAFRFSQGLYRCCFFMILGVLLQDLPTTATTKRQIHSNTLLQFFFLSLLKRTHIDTYIIMYLGRTSPTGCTRGVFIWELPLKNGIFHWKSPWFTGNVCMFVCWFVGGVFSGPLHALQLLCNSHQSVYGLTLLP